MAAAGIIWSLSSFGGWWSPRRRLMTYRVPRLTLVGPGDGGQRREPFHNSFRLGTVKLCMHARAVVSYRHYTALQCAVVVFASLDVHSQQVLSHVDDGFLCLWGHSCSVPNSYHTACDLKIKTHSQALLTPMITHQTKHTVSLEDWSVLTNRMAWGEVFWLVAHRH